METIFEMRKEFKHYPEDLNGYAAKTVSDKQELRKKLRDITVDRKRFDEVLKLQTEKILSRRREKMREHGLSGNKEGQSLPDYARTYSEGTRTYSDGTRRFQMKTFYDKPIEILISQ